MEIKSNEKKYLNKSSNKKNIKKGNKKKLGVEDTFEKKDVVQTEQGKKIILSPRIIDWFLSIFTVLSLLLNAYAFTEIKNRYYLKDPIYFSLIDRNMSFSVIVIIVNIMVYLFAALEIVSAIKNKDDYRFVKIVFSIFSILTTLIVVIAFGTLVVNFTK